MITIRCGTAEDDRALAEIDQATWSPKVTPAGRPEPGAAFSDDPNRLTELLVAEVDGVVAGYVALHQEIPLPSHAHVLEINGLAVGPVHQGLGVGRRLVEAAKQEAARRGARKLSLRVLAPNASARRLYESCGFRVVAVLEDEFLLDGELTDDVLMACPLGAPSRAVPEHGTAAVRIALLALADEREMLDFELENRSFFTRTVGDRGDEYFAAFTTRHARLVAENEAGTSMLFAVRDRDGRVVGRVNIGPIEDGSGDIGYRFAEHACGRGYATAAVALALQAAAGRGLTRVDARTTQDNAASRRVLEANGFEVVTGVEPAELEICGRRLRAVHFSRTLATVRR